LEEEAIVTGWALLGGTLATAAGDALVAAALFLSCGLIGFSLLPARTRGRARLSLPLALSVGVTAVGSGSWVVGSLVGTRATLPLLAVLLLQSLRTWRSYARAFNRWARAAWLLARSQPWLATVLLLVLAALGPQLLLPVSDSDGMRYHLALPKLFILTGSVFRYQYDFTGGLPQLAEMVYLLGLQLGRAETAKFLHTGMFLGTLAVLAAVVYRGPRSRAAALLAPLAWAATPLVLTVAATSFVDHFAAFHCAVALLLAGAGASPALVGCALGGALGTRLTAAPFVAGVVVVVVLLAGRKRALQASASMLIPVAIVLAPFAVRNTLSTGDPFFPLGRGLVGLPIQGVSTERVKLTTHYHPPSTGFLGITWGAVQERASADEIAGWHNLLAMLALVLAVRDRRLRLLAAPVAFTLVLGFWFRPPTRYLMPMFLCLAALGAIAVARVRWRLALWAAVAALVPAFATGLSFVLTYQRPFDYLAGRLDRDGFCSRYIPGWRAVRLVNAQAPGGRVMALDFPALMYFDRPWIAEGMMIKPPLQEWIERAGDGGEVLRRLQAEKVRLLVVTPGYGGGSRESLLPLASTPAQLQRTLALRASLELVGTRDGVDVYRVP